MVMELWIETPEHLDSAYSDLMSIVFEHRRGCAAPQLLCIKCHFQAEHGWPGAGA